MIKSIRSADKTKGTGKKVILDDERELREFATRSIQAIKNIKKGEILRFEENFSILLKAKNKYGNCPRDFFDPYSSTSKLLSKKTSVSINYFGYKEENFPVTCVTETYLRKYDVTKISSQIYKILSTDNGVVDAKEPEEITKWSNDEVKQRAYLESHLMCKDLF